MSKNAKKKTQELPPIQKYQNENMIEDLGNKFKCSNDEIERLKQQLKQKNLDIEEKGKKYVLQTKDTKLKLEETEKQNADLNNEITEIKKNQDEFERDCKKKFDEKFLEVEEEKQRVIEDANEKIETMRADLEEHKKETEDLRNRNRYLKGELERLNTAQRLTIESYEEKIRKLNEEHQLKIALTTEIFENFLRNNQELLNTDLYSVYRTLKKKFDTKIKECLDFKQRNEKLIDQNKMFRISLDNGDEMINECAKIQVESKKKTKQLSMELSEKNKLINKIKEEYQRQVDELTEKFKIYNEETNAQVQELKTALAIKKKELDELRYRAQTALNERSELELFFIDSLREVKKEIAEKRRKEYERKNSGLFPFLNSSVSSSCTTNGRDESTFVTSIKKVEIKDLDPESKEKLLRALLNKVNEGKQNQNFAKLRKSLY